MHFSFGTFAVALLVGVQSVGALPAQGSRQAGNNNSQLAQLLQGTGIRGMRSAQLNALIRNIQAAGLCTAAGGDTEAGNDGNTGGEGEGEEGEGSKYFGMNSGLRH
jgi:hypothetical protein